MVQQEPILFNNTIKYNISYGDSSKSLKQIKDSVEFANASDFIKDLKPQDEDDMNIRDPLERGLQYVCGVKGGSLSGGQKQRIAIARAIVRQPKILMLDEATSALDEQSQEKVQDALERAMENQTSIVIAHRLTTIENADRLVVIK